MLLQLYNVGERNVLGTLPETNRGNKYILVAIDNISKWPEGYANQEAVTVTDVLVSQFFSQFGVLVSCTLTKAKISNLWCSRRYAPCSESIRPVRLPYIHSLKTWWSATTKL